ncbi:MAG: putative sulfate exporter family transporter [Actinomycetaceae bacterium]|nr:putative sulfate exporter family transporter [Actinomycetaceae bacterium]
MSTIKERLYGLPALLPGIVLSLVIATIAYGVHFYASLISPLLFAILAGVFVRNAQLIPTTAEPGVKFSSKTILRFGVVLLGMNLSIPEVLALGWGPVVVIIATVACTYAATLAFGRLLRVAHTTRVLTATGTAICGAAAVAGMAAVVRRHNDDDDDVEAAAATAVASVTLFGTVTMLAVPPLATWMGLTVQQTGVWIGSAIHEVGQVVAAAGFISPEVVDIATLTKLGRVVMLAPLVAVAGFFEARSYTKIREEQIEAEEVHRVITGEPVDHAPATTVKPPIMPLFVAGFLMLVVLRSIIGSSTSLESFYGWVDVVAKVLLTVAMGAMGAGVNLPTIIRTGGKAMLLGTIACIAAGLVSLGLTLLLV